LRGKVLLHPVALNGKCSIGAVVDDETQSVGRGIPVEKGGESGERKSSTGEVNVILREIGFLQGGGRSCSSRVWRARPGGLGGGWSLRVHLEGRETCNVDNEMEQIYMIRKGVIIRTKYRKGSYEGAKTVRQGVPCGPESLRAKNGRVLR
jgi:hypothetical protein